MTKLEARRTKVTWEPFERPITAEEAAARAAESRRSYKEYLAKNGTLYKGVLLISRYDEQHEIDTMKRVLDCIGFPLRDRMVTIFCDSKETSSYSVTVRPGRFNELLEMVLSTAFLAVDGGYNLINFEDDVTGEQLSFLGDDWGEVDEHL